MKTLLFSTLIVVFTLVCVTPAGAQVTKNHNNVNCSKCTEQSKKSNSTVPSTTNQPTKPNNTAGAKPANIGKPDNPIPAGSR